MWSCGSPKEGLYSPTVLGHGVSKLGGRQLASGYDIIEVMFVHFDLEWVRMTVRLFQ